MNLTHNAPYLYWWSLCSCSLWRCVPWYLQQTMLNEQPWGWVIWILAFRGNYHHGCGHGFPLVDRMPVTFSRLNRWNYLRVHPSNVCPPYIPIPGRKGKAESKRSQKSLRSSTSSSAITKPCCRSRRWGRFRAVRVRVAYESRDRWYLRTHVINKWIGWLVKNQGILEIDDWITTWNVNHPTSAKSNQSISII